MSPQFASAVVLMGGLLTALQPAYPLDQELESSFSGRVSVKMSCKVTKVGEVYCYMYSIKNTSSKPARVKWDLISQAMYFGHNLDLMIDLEPDENVVFTLEHPDPPIATYGRVTSYYLTNSTKLEKMIQKTPEIPKNMRIEISKKTLYSSESGSGHGALPKSFLPNGRIR